MFKETKFLTAQTNFFGLKHFAFSFPKKITKRLNFLIYCFTVTIYQCKEYKYSIVENENKVYIKIKIILLGQKDNIKTAQNLK